MRITTTCTAFLLLGRRLDAFWVGLIRGVFEVSSPTCQWVERTSCTAARARLASLSLGGVLETLVDSSRRVYILHVRVDPLFHS